VLLDFVCKINDDHGYVCSPAHPLHVDLRRLGSSNSIVRLFQAGIIAYPCVAMIPAWKYVVLVQVFSSYPLQDPIEKVYFQFSSRQVYLPACYEFDAFKSVYYSYVNGLLEQGNRSHTLHGLVSLF